MKQSSEPYETIERVNIGWWMGMVVGCEWVVNVCGEVVEARGRGVAGSECGGVCGYVEGERVCLCGEGGW